MTQNRQKIVRRYDFCRFAEIGLLVMIHDVTAHKGSWTANNKKLTATRNGAALQYDHSMAVIAREPHSNIHNP